MRIPHPAYAYAIFCTRDEFARLDPNIRLGRDYDDWRSDILRQYPRLRSLDIHGIAAFVRSHWWGLSQLSSHVPLPDSFDPKSGKGGNG